MSLILLETIYSSMLFILFLAIWKFKRYFQKKNSGKDPEVLAKSKSNIQIFVNRLFKIITMYALVLIFLHHLNIQFFSMFSRFELLNYFQAKTAGFIIGLTGLALCLYAQIKMGNSWRVGIDEKDRSELVMGGLYKFIRNPTYLGLFIFNFGVWIIIPTWTICILNTVFILSLEFQVRCEEDFLEKTFGEIYIEYKKKTWRYIPFIY